MFTTSGSTGQLISLSGQFKFIIESSVMIFMKFYKIKAFINFNLIILCALFYYYFIRKKLDNPAKANATKNWWEVNVGSESFGSIFKELITSIVYYFIAVLWWRKISTIFRFDAYTTIRSAEGASEANSYLERAMDAVNSVLV